MVFLHVNIWGDRSQQLRNTWFGFLVCVIFLLLRVCLSECPFLYDNLLWAVPERFGLAMVVAVLSTTSSCNVCLQ